MDNEPYTAVIFTNQRTDVDDDGYVAMAERMEALASEQPGYIGIDSVRDTAGQGITVSYWVDADAARAWKANAEHLVAQRQGRGQWYDTYTVRIASVGREYSYSRPIFHMAMPDDWLAAQAVGTYAMSTRGMTVADEGFMHCSFAHQMRGVAERFYGDVDEITILHVDRDMIPAQLRIEPPADGIDELFPHIYGVLPIEAVTATSTWERGAGAWGDPPIDLAPDIRGR